MARGDCVAFDHWSFYRQRLFRTAAASKPATLRISCVYNAGRTRRHRWATIDDEECLASLLVAP
jgi:hypothetical protein